MLRNDTYDLLWSSWIDEEICNNIYDNNCVNQCSEDYDCPYRNGCDLDYDFINMRIDEEFHNKFGNVNHKYFVVGDSCNWYGGFPNLKPNMNGFSDLYDNLKELLDKLSKDVGQHDFRIYKGKYNTLWIELSHHDGSELYQVCRLNRQGQDYYDKYYNFDFRKHCVKGVFKDFEKNFK